MRRRTVLIVTVLLLIAAVWGWRNSAGLTGGEEAARLDQTAAVPSASVLSTEGDTAAPPVPGATPPGAVAPSGPDGSSIPAATTAQGAPATADGAPSFDVVRVEPDGSTVVAGRAKPGEVVTLRSGANRLAEVRASASGDFVLDLTLPAGEHRLQLSDAANALSRDAAVVSVPAPERPRDLLVLMDRPGQLSEIIAAPPLAVAPPAVGEAMPPAAPSASEPRVATVEPQSAPAPASAPVARPTLGVEAVEVENRRLSVAGAAPAGSRLKIYLDNELIGQTDGTGDDRFIANAMADVSVGQHTVRIDEIGPGGVVIARAEVPFTRPDENAMAAIAPAVPPVAVAPHLPAAPSLPAEAPPALAVDPAPAGASVPPNSSAPVVAAAEVGPATVVQPALEAAQAKVIIRRGDSLWRISRRAYGQGVRYTVIYLANGDQIRDPDRIYPGQVFRMPDDNGRPPRS